MKASYNTLSEAITDYQKKGYTVDFNLSEHHLESKSIKQQWNPEGNLLLSSFIDLKGIQTHQIIPSCM